MNERLNARSKTGDPASAIIVMIALCGMLLMVSGVVAWWGWPAGAIVMGFLVFSIAITGLNSVLK